MHVIRSSMVMHYLFGWPLIVRNIIKLRYKKVNANIYVPSI